MADTKTTPPAKAGSAKPAAPARAPDAEPELAGVPEGVGPADPEVAEEVPPPEAKADTKAAVPTPVPTPEAKQPEPAAAAPQSTPAASTLSDGERKRLRRDLFGGVAQNEFAKAIAAGLALEKAGALDWEAAFSLACAQQQGGQSTLALTRFTDFIATYPRNEFVDDAYFHSGEILQARGRTQDAIAAFQQVVARPKSNWLEQAKAHLTSLGVAPP